MDPTLSIIIPFNNSSKYLSRCIDSILCQSFTSYEVILVNDGSTDASEQICLGYAGKDKRVHYIFKPNGGVSSARNLGINISSGVYLLFVDSDDELYPDALMRMCNIPADCDLFIGGYNVVDDDGNLSYSIPDRTIRKLNREEGIKQMYSPSPYKYQGYIWNKLFRKYIIDSSHIRFDEDIHFNEDRLFVTRYIAAQTGAILYDLTPVYKYYERPGSAMASINNTFNPKFVTDFYAMVRMRYVVRKTFRCKALNHLAQEAVYLSYGKIHLMMSKSFDKEIHRKMKMKLIKSLSLPFLIDKLLHRDA